MVEHHVRDVGAAGSNPVTSTNQKRYPTGYLFLINMMKPGFEPAAGFSKSLIWKKQSGGLFRRRLGTLEILSPRPIKKDTRLGIFF